MSGTSKSKARRKLRESAVRVILYCCLVEGVKSRGTEENGKMREEKWNAAKAEL